jgi:hypothetical protein
MNAPIRSLLLTSSLVLAAMPGVFAADEKPAPVAPAPEPTILLADFRANVPGLFVYSSWQGKVSTTSSGTLVQGSSGAQGDGGMGSNIATALDLSHATYVEIALGLGVHNEVPELTIALNDADGTQVAARVRVDQLMPNQPVWLRVRRDQFTRVSGQDGRDGKLDWTKIGQWHVQGDWKTKKSCHVIFIALRLR